jgi:hypothetical protein
MLERLMGEVATRFYRPDDVRKWMRDQRAIMQALTWPAAWLNERGVGLPARDYEAKILEILGIITAHGDLANIRYIPSYLSDCIRKHFIHHGDEIYAARKHVRALMDLRFLERGPVAPTAPDATAALAAAHRVLATAKRRPKIQKNEATQPLLF